MATATLDFLATTVISALEAKGMAPSWINGKEHEFKGMDRLKVLRSLTNLDDGNLQAVCNEIEVSIEDMKATFRVLRKI